MAADDDAMLAMAVQEGAHAAASAAERLLGSKANDQAIVAGAVRSAAIKIGFGLGRMNLRSSDDEVRAWWRSSAKARERELVIRAVTIGLHANNVGGRLPPERADSLYA